MNITIEIDSILLGEVGDPANYRVKYSVKHGGHRSSTDFMCSDLVTVADKVRFQIGDTIIEIAENSINREEWAKFDNAGPKK